MKRRGLYLALLVTVAGMLAITATAQAENAWWILGKALSEKKEVSVSMKAGEELKLVITSKGTEFRCNNLELKDGLLLKEGESSGTISISSCTTYLNEALSTACKPVEPIAAIVKGSVAIHSEKFYDLLVPAEGSTFTTLKFSEPCPLPSEVPVTGSLVLECLESSCTQEATSHLVQEAPEASFPSDGLKYMGQTAKLLGKVTVKLGDNWSAYLTPGGPWMVNGSNVVSDLAVTVVSKEDKEIELLTKFTGIEVGIACHEVKTTKALLEAAGRAQVIVELTSCNTFIGGTLSKSCKPFEPIVMGATLETFIYKGKLYVRALGTSGVFTTLEFAPPCTLAEEIVIRGTIWLEDGEGAIESEQSTHLVQEAKNVAEAVGGMKFGTEPLLIDGSLLIEEVKVGTSAALKFSVLAG